MLRGDPDGRSGVAFPNKWRKRENCSLYPLRTSSQTPERGAPGALLRAREPRRSLPGIQAPRSRLTPLGAELRGGRKPPAVPHLCSPKASSSAAAAAQEAAPHARRAAALRRALQPGEARASAELGPSSLGATGPASEQGEETAPRADPPPPAPPPRRPRARPTPLTCPLPGRRRRRRLAARRAPWPHGLPLPLPPGCSVRRPSALRKLSGVEVVTRRRKSERAGAPRFAVEPLEPWRSLPIPE